MQNIGLKSRDHLFFGCPFSQGVWKEVLRMCNLERRVQGLEQELKWAVQRIKVAWTALIYHVWTERNHRIFAQKEETVEQVLNRIREAIRFRLDKWQNV